MAVGYNYQLQYEICSLLFLLALALQYLSAKKFPTITNRLFSAIIICSVFDLTFDILGCLTVMHPDKVPLWVNYMVNGLFYCLHLIIPVLAEIYAIHAAGKAFRRNPKLFLILVPAVVFLLMQFMNPFTGAFFSFEEIDGTYMFMHGPLSNVYYICAAFYLISLVVTMLTNRSNLTRKQIGTMCLFSTIVSVAMVMQFMLPDIILTGMAITISIILWDLTLQNPDNLIDDETGAFDSSGLKLFIDNCIRSGKVYIIVIDVSGMNATEREIGNLSTSVMMKRIGAFFSSLSIGRVWYFRDTKTRFWVAAKTEAELSEMSTMIVERFKEPWDAGELTIDLMARVLSVSTNTTINITTPELISIIYEVLDEESVFTNQSRNVIIDSTYLARHRRRQILEESMRRSIKTHDGFYIVFQPIININDSGKVSAEVLLRYNDTNLGGVSPVEFIPVIEQCGMAVFVDSMVVEMSCEFLSRHPEVELLHINLSGAEFFHNPTKRISDIVLSNGIDPKRICFEITESAAAKNPKLLMDFMRQMILIGFSFALDDYGTGYSNIYQVLKMPFRLVKIDKVLLKDDKKSRTFLESSIKLFHNIGLEPVIEGVESKPMLDLVTSLGATDIQGFLFSPPLVEKDYTEFVNNGNRGR